MKANRRRLTHLQLCCLSGCSSGRAFRTVSLTNWLSTWLKNIHRGAIKWWLWILICSAGKWWIMANTQCSPETVYTCGGYKSTPWRVNQHTYITLSSETDGKKMSHVEWVGCTWLTRWLMAEVCISEDDNSVFALKVEESKEWYIIFHRVGVRNIAEIWYHYNWKHFHYTLCAS